MNDKLDRLRRLPSVDQLLSRERAQELVQQYSRELVVDSIRDSLESSRRRILDARVGEYEEVELLDDVETRLQLTSCSSLRPVINATGVIIHTNLGRALLSDAAQRAITTMAGAYNTLEFDLEAGKRGSRQRHASQLLSELTGADDALVVNNNAAALILILRALALSQEVIISRGQLVEIGGGFRIPDIMRASGARLIEVGATNRTRIADYKAAVTEETAIILRVHASNFKQLGFVQQASPAELTTCAHEYGFIAVDDLGSGTLIDTRQFGLSYEPTVQDSIRAGFDLVCFSGDKLLGGPQAGVIIGKAALIARLKRHPLAQALRVDKLTYAALNATLEHYRRDEALDRVPVWRMISRSLDDIEREAKLWAQQVGGTVIAGESTVGGGSMPGATLSTALLALETNTPDSMMAHLRACDPPVIARVSAGRVLLDPRTVLPQQRGDLLQALKTVVGD